MRRSDPYMERARELCLAAGVDPDSRVGEGRGQPAWCSYRDAARKVKIVKTTAERYYGRGYQDVQNRVPKIDNTMRELRWRPRVGMRDALKRIYDAYRTDIAEARHLVK